MTREHALKATIRAAVDRWAERLWASSLAIHSTPELGYREEHTADLLCSLLEHGGIAMERGIADMPTAFRGIVLGRTSRPAIAILAEMDALPEIGHGCGHNLIGAAAVGAGLALAEARAELPGSAVILGCPAEETAVDGAGGKIRLLKAGAFDAIDAAIMVHPGTLDLVPLSPTLASCGLEFEFLGKAAHASLSPQAGINALDGVLSTFAAVKALCQELPPDVRINGIITHGGVSANIIPDRAVCRFRVRAADRASLAEVSARVTACAEAGANECGARFVVREFSPVYAEMRPSATVSHVLYRNLALLGRPVTTSSPAEGKASTDLGNVSHVVPSASATVAIADDSVAFHSLEFAVAAASPVGRRMLLDSAKALAMSALDLMSDPGLLEAARQEMARDERGAKQAFRGS